MIPNVITSANLLCRSDSLVTGERGLRFEVTDWTRTYAAFVIRSTEGVAGFGDRDEARLGAEVEVVVGNDRGGAVLA